MLAEHEAVTADALHARLARARADMQSLREENAMLAAENDTLRAQNTALVAENTRIVSGAEGSRVREDRLEETNRLLCDELAGLAFDSRERSWDEARRRARLSTRSGASLMSHW